MSTSTDTTHTAGGAPKLPDSLRLGPVQLAVADLERSINFYAQSIGLRLQGRSNGEAALGAGREDLLILAEQPPGRPAGRHAGLYHFALLHPSRLELARAAQRLAATHTPIGGASDHGISEAIYLPDPDGNGIELAADRPREQWGDLRDPKEIGPRPLDLDGLLRLVAGEEARPKADPGLVVGHLHLHVGDIERALAFYRDILGFEVMTLFPTAAFISAGGYHHHLGLNTWRGVGVPPQPADAVGLRLWTIFLEDRADVDTVRERVRSATLDDEQRDGGFVVRDPWDIPVLFTTRSG
jgi:catechol 2,3-dioxygenase